MYLAMNVSGHVFFCFVVVVVYMYFGHVYMCVQGIIDIIVSIN